MQPEAVASGFITAVYLRLLSELAAPLGFGDALEQLRRVARGHRMAAGTACPIAQRQLPILLTQFESHIQRVCLSRMLLLKGCFGCIHLLLSRQIELVELSLLT